MPSGSAVQVDIHTSGMNIYVQGLPRDQGKTYGLCGNYDGDKNNDLQDHRTQFGKKFTLPPSRHPKDFTDIFKLVFIIMIPVKPLMPCAQMR